VEVVILVIIACVVRGRLKRSQFFAEKKSAPQRKSWLRLWYKPRNFHVNGIYKLIELTDNGIF